MGKDNKKFIFYLEITTFCNMACPFCPSFTSKSNKYMEYNSVISAINSIKDYCKLLYFHVLGEPLLHPDFLNIIQYCENENISFAITTNGTLLDKYKNKILNMKNISKINISLQSLVQYSKEQLDIYLNNLNEFLNYRREINSTIPINLRLWNDKTSPETIILNNYLENYFEEFIVNNRNIRFSEANEFEWPSTKDTINENLSNCLGGKNQFAILVDGTISLCCLDHEGKTKIGNIFVNDFKTVLKSDLLKKVIDGFNDRKPYFKLCKNCTFRNRFK